ncbi:MAG TPA: OsmC family protein [Bacteroidales bacterium]|nr:OsmC family protein [Bacteroidales bacterium]
MHTSETIYLGNLRTENIHVRSGQKVVTDAPIDNKGKGECFSPTDLVATGLCNCILTIAGMAAEEHGFSITGAKAKTTKIMAQEPLRKIAEIQIEFDFSMCNLNKKQQIIIEHVPSLCPVSLSLSTDVKQKISFKF